MVCRLQKSLYGLKQASRSWYSKFSHAICKLSFVHSLANDSLFTKTEGDSFTTVLIYVDDMIIIGNDPNSIKQLKLLFNSQFKIKDLGKLKYFLRIEVAHSIKGISISWRKYTLDLLAEVGLLGAAFVSMPMRWNLKLSPTQGELLNDLSKYRMLIGKLLYLTISRLDIQYPVHHLSQFLIQPRKSHYEAVICILKCLKGSLGQGYFFQHRMTSN